MESPTDSEFTALPDQILQSLPTVSAFTPPPGQIPLEALAVQALQAISTTSSSAVHHLPAAESTHDHHQTSPVDNTKLIEQIFEQLPYEDKVGVVSPFFFKLRPYPKEADFIRLSLDAMNHLERKGKSNIMYKLAYVLGTMREDKTDSRMPVSRAPFGLLEYNINFFAANNVQAVSKNIQITLYISINIHTNAGTMSRGL